ncbi:glycosyltransferase family 9 protein [Rhodococcus sovatensis]|uniref:Glycosyltransferase family 9 protein n=1 Tax=Rhodococcus sovatensis TaxID=1805840 RepID=A0ABZ2PQH4_9NOCA
MSAKTAPKGGKVLVARLDSMGDVLLTGPAIRAVARSSASVTALVGPRGVAAAELLPGVDRVRVLDAPWVSLSPEALDPESVRQFIDDVKGEQFDAALIFTSFHQSPLPLALLLRMAGVHWIGAISVDYPGSLLDVRHTVPEDLPESERALSLAEAAGFTRDDAGSTLAVRHPLPTVDAIGLDPFVVYHPGAAVSARMPTAEHSRAIVESLVAEEFTVIVTGGADERALAEYVADGRATNLAGTLSLAELASLYARAQAVVVPNTGPAHLAAAVGVPTVSLFAPVVPAARWAPYGTPMILLGEQDSPCRDTRARECPLPGHPCLSSISPYDVVDAVRRLTRRGCEPYARSEIPIATTMAGGPA